jgi:23S rRNA (guanine745-N1)-methyltransferase
MDGLALAPVGAQMRCAAGHSYDVSREGYCNLLLVQQKASRDPGDSKEMVAARRRFLERGHFGPIADRAFAVAWFALDEMRERTAAVLDAGCGEGYFLQRFAELAAADASGSAVTLAGIDVSKWAVKAAAKRKVPAAWAVASNKQPPFLPGSIDLVLCLFGFPAWEGFRKVQPPDGFSLLVDPGPEHLIELREIIYPRVRRTPPPSLSAAEAAGYKLVREEGLRYETVLTQAEEIRDLLAMTPHGHRVPSERRGAFEGLQRLSVTVDVALRLLQL